MDYAIPTRQQILKDFRKQARKNPWPECVRFQAVRVVSRWIRCGYDINELPMLVRGLTPEIFQEGANDAAHIKRMAA